MKSTVYERLMKEAGGMFENLLDVPADFAGESMEHYDARLLAWEAAGKPEAILFWSRRWEPGYCTQNNGDCATCSLVNYGRDCHNAAINPPVEA